MKFIMHTDKIVATRHGHTIEFKAGVPTHVPKECWNAVREQGAVAEDQQAVDEANAKKPVKTENDPVEREKAILTAIEMMVESNKRGDFAASGLPNLKPLEAIVGFDVDVRERDAVWAKYQAAHKA
jgi:hypothetical protein